MTTADSPIEDYLDQLYLALDGSPRDNRRLLDESAAHLYAAAEELAGTDRVHAERAVVARFGSPEVIAAAQRRAVRPGASAVAVDLARAGVLLGGWAMVAIGLSGALAAAMNLAFGSSFVGGLPESYSPGQCSRLLAVQAGAGSCLRAGVLETSADAVTLRVLAGLVGAVLLVAWYFTRRRRAVIPDLAVDAVAATGALGAAAVLIGLSIDQAVQHGSGGVGFYLSGGLAAAAIGAVFAIAFLRGVSRPASAGSAAPPPNFGPNTPG